MIAPGSWAGRHSPVLARASGLQAKSARSILVTAAMHWTTARGGEASCALWSYEGFRALEVLACLFSSLPISLYGVAELPEPRGLAASPNKYVIGSGCMQRVAAFVA